MPSSPSMANNSIPHLTREHFLRLWFCAGTQQSKKSHCLWWFVNKTSKKLWETCLLMAIWFCLFVFRKTVLQRMENRTLKPKKYWRSQFTVVCLCVLIVAGPMLSKHRQFKKLYAKGFMPLCNFINYQNISVL